MFHEDAFKISFLGDTYTRQYTRDEKNLRIIITFATVTWQSLKSARTNPVDSLRYE